MSTIDPWVHERYGHFNSIVDDSVDLDIEPEGLDDDALNRIGINNTPYDDIADSIRLTTATTDGFTFNPTINWTNTASNDIHINGELWYNGETLHVWMNGRFEELSTPLTNDIQLLNGNVTVNTGEIDCLRADIEQNRLKILELEDIIRRMQDNGQDSP